MFSKSTIKGDLKSQNAPAKNITVIQTSVNASALSFLT